MTEETKNKIGSSGEAITIILLWVVLLDRWGNVFSDVPLSWVLLAMWWVVFGAWMITFKYPSNKERDLSGWGVVYIGFGVAVLIGLATGV